MADTQMPDCPPVTSSINSPDPCKSPADFSHLGFDSLLLDRLHRPRQHTQHEEQSRRRENLLKKEARGTIPSKVCKQADSLASHTWTPNDTYTPRDYSEAAVSASRTRCTRTSYRRKEKGIRFVCSGTCHKPENLSSPRRYSLFFSPHGRRDGIEEPET